MSKNKRIAVTIFCVLMLVAMALCFTACVNYEEIYNDNDKLSANSSSYSSMNYSFQLLPSEECTVSAKSFSGIKKIKTVSSIESPKLDITLKISSGSFKVIAVKKDNKAVYTLIDKDNTELLKTELPAGDYDIKLVGIKGDFDLTIDLKSFEG